MRNFARLRLTEEKSRVQVLYVITNCSKLMRYIYNYFLIKLAFPEIFLPSDYERFYIVFLVCLILLKKTKYTLAGYASFLFIKGLQRDVVYLC
jgi:hypothetical protein